MSPLAKAAIAVGIVIAIAAGVFIYSSPRPDPNALPTIQQR